MKVLLVAAGLLCWPPRSVCTLVLSVCRKFLEVHARRFDQLHVKALE